MRNNAIKLILAVMAVISLLGCVFYGCVNEGNVEPSHAPNTGDPSLELAPSPTVAPPSQPVATVPSFIDSTSTYKAKIVPVQYTEDPLKPIVVTSFEDWMSLEDYTTIKTTGDYRTMNPLTDFNETTFKSSVMVVGEVVLSSGSMTLEVKDVDTSGEEIRVTLSSSLEGDVGTADMAQYRIFIVLPRSMYNDQTVAVFDMSTPDALAGD